MNKTICTIHDSMTGINKKDAALHTMYINARLRSKLFTGQKVYSVCLFLPSSDQDGLQGFHELKEGPYKKSKRFIT